MICFVFVAFFFFFFLFVISISRIPFNHKYDIGTLAYSVQDFKRVMLSLFQSCFHLLFSRNQHTELRHQHIGLQMFTPKYEFNSMLIYYECVSDITLRPCDVTCGLRYRSMFTKIKVRRHCHLPVCQGLFYQQILAKPALGWRHW